jgi:autotransporter-associated beta strand protein
VTLANTGTVATSVDNQFNLTGGLVMGSAAGATAVTSLDLTNGGGTFGSLLVQTNSASANTILIGDGKTLQINGPVTIGYNSPATSATKLTLSGLGTFSIGSVGAPTNASFQLGNGQTSGFSNAGTLDLTGLSTFYANLGTGVFRIGDPVNSGGTGTAGSTLILAPDSTINAATFTTDSPSGNFAQAVKLGSGTNVINANVIEIGGAANRAIATLTFNVGTGSLQIRNQATTGRATLNVAAGNTATGFVTSGTVNLLGHNSNLLLSTLNVGARSNGGGTAPSDGSGTANAAFSFDTGTLDATTLNVAVRSGANKLGTVTSNLNLGGGTVLADALNIATNSTTSSSGNTGGSAVGSVDIFGNTSATFGSLSLASTSGAAVNVATGSLLLRGTASVTLNGDLTRGGGNGTENTTFTLNGALLDMTNHNIGSAAAAIGSGSGTLNFQSGTLKNLHQLNGGGALTKTTTGTLTLDGLNAYTGPTNINDGTVRAAAANAFSAASAVSLADVSGATLDLNGLDQAVAALAGGGVTGGNVNLGAGKLTVGTTSGSTSFAGAISGTNGGLTKTGTSTQTLTGLGNSYTGPTLVKGGTLAISGRLTGTASVQVENGGALQFSGTQTDRINDLATVALNNLGTLAFEGTVNGGLSESVSTLSLNGSATLDFGTGTNGNTLLFAPAVTFANGSSLAIWNWSGGPYLLGQNDSGSLGDAQDRLLFAGGSSGLSAAQLGQISFFSDAGTTLLGTAQEVSFGGNFEIVPVPEPSSAALLGAVGLVAFAHSRKRRAAGGGSK